MLILFLFFSLPICRNPNFYYRAVFFYTRVAVVRDLNFIPRWWGEYRVISTHAVETHLNMKER